MECSICEQKFTADDRRPKVLPCGHSYCLPCVRQLPNKECPVDKKRFKSAASKLPDNFMLIKVKQEKEKLSTTPASTPPPSPAVATPRLWCRSCNSEVTESCADEHPASICSLKKARSDRAAPRLAGLQANEAALRGLQSELDDAADGLDAELAASRGRLVDGLDALDRAREQLQAAVEADEAVFEEASEAAGLDGLARDAARLLPALGDPASRCSVSLEGPGGAWTASVQPGQRPAARLLLCQLACAGELRPQGDDQHDGDVSTSQAVCWQEKSNAGERDSEYMSSRMVVGERVVRGADWPVGSTADGQPPRPGTVVAEDGGNVTVEWDCGGRGDYAMGLKRAGKEVYELELLPRMNFYMVAGIEEMNPAFLRVRDISSSLDVRKKADLMADQKLDKVLALVDLRCDASPAWSKEVLRRVAPRLKGLRLLAPDVEHLLITKTMPALHALHLAPVDTETMQMALSMPGVTSLEVHCPFEAPLGALRLPKQPKLYWLCIGVHPLSAALSVVRAHAATLETLWLVAASKEPYGCPDLAAELRGCGLKKLKTLGLDRESEVQFCQHDKDSCTRQKLSLIDMFMKIGLIVKVSCADCDSTSCCD